MAGTMAALDGGEAPAEFHVMHLEPRPFRPFRSSEEYLYAMKEDLAEWLNALYGLDISVDTFLETLETGVVLCRHANNVLRMAREWRDAGRNGLSVPIPDRDVVYRLDVLPGTFQARDNVSNFITWCRMLAIKECLLFETDDLVLRKNERSFILCLLEVARQGVKFGMPAPLLVQMEQEIDAELAKESSDDDSDTLSEPPVQIITNDLRSLHERVVDLLSRCICPSQFPMIRVADGKYRIGDTKILIFVRILRSHVMVRVGGGWDTLEHYLDKHDPCRCRAGHRLSTSAKLTMMPGKGGTPQMQVTYNRPPPAPFPVNLSSLGRNECLPSTPLSPQFRRRQSQPNGIPIGQDFKMADLPPRVSSRNSQYSDDSSASSSSMQVRCDSPPSEPTRSPQRRASHGHLGSVSADSSSEFSESETASRNGCSNDIQSANLASRQRKYSPRKIMRTGEDIELDSPLIVHSGWKFSNSSPERPDSGLAHESSETSSVVSGEDHPPARLTDNHSERTSLSAVRKQSSLESSLPRYGKSGLPRKDSLPSKIPAPKTLVKSGSHDQQPSSKRLLFSHKAQSIEDLYGSRIPVKGYGGYYSSQHSNSPHANKGRGSANDHYYSPGIPRSRSHSSGPDEEGFMRNGPGRFSSRTPRATERPKLVPTSKTWACRQRPPRMSVNQDIFGNKSANAWNTSGRSTSPGKLSPQRPTRNPVFLSSQNTTKQYPSVLSANKQISPLLREILQDVDLDSDEMILQKMEKIVNQYRDKAEPRAKDQEHCSNGFGEDEEEEEAEDTSSSSKPRRDPMGNSRIPMPTWYRRD